jgi:uncharacterized membrane protein YgdD (TMEM256/DUF423 family)
VASCSGLLAVALGAFGAHVLRPQLTGRAMDAYQTGVLYHLVHSLALLVVGILALRDPRSVRVVWAGWLFLAGIILFSGSLYLLAVTGVTRLGALTPFGGVAFLCAWGLLAFAVGRERR